jgi:hypothetical protein
MVDATAKFSKPSREAHEHPAHGLPASPKRDRLDANALNSLPKEKAGALQTNDLLIVVPKGWLPKEGAKLTEGLIVGKRLGAGLQAAIYQLKDPDGNVNQEIVLKCKHPRALLTKMQREWEVGRRVSSLQSKDEMLPGFMGVGQGVCSETGEFQGMVLEYLNGKDCAKVITRPGFHDIHYIREMLFSIFCALDVAQKTLGFHHADLRLVNVMDIGPEPGAPFMPADAAAGAAGRMASDASPDAPKTQKDVQAQGQRQQQPAHNVMATGNGPTQVAGGSMGLTSTAIDASAANGPATTQYAIGTTVGTNGGRWPQPAVSAFAGHGSPSLEEPYSSHASQTGGASRAASIPARGTGAPALRQPHRYKVIDYGLADFEARYAAGMVGAEASQGTDRAPKEASFRSRRAKGVKRNFLPLPLDVKNMHLIPKVSPLERFWRHLWRRKGDVYHLFFDMCRFMDGRVWPKKDKVDVLLFLSMMMHVTGVPLKAWFGEIEGSDADAQAMKLKTQFIPCGAFERSDGTFHILRVRGVRIRGWLSPHNPGLTAAEVLTSPFFRPCYEHNWAAGVRKGPARVPAHAVTQKSLLAPINSE